MAISLLAAFKAIPWTDVLAAAPTIVQSAEKLWGTVTRKKNEQDAAEINPVEHPAPQEAPTLSGLDARLQLLDARFAELHSEALSSSELIKSLAEQNAQLVRAVEILRRRTRVLTRWCALLTVIAAIAAISLWMR